MGTQKAAAAASERPKLPAQFVVVDRFLPTPQVDELIRYALEHESDFEKSEVVSPAGTSAIDDSYRRSRVLMEIGRHEKVIVRHMKAILPRVLKRLHHRIFHISRVDVQVTASNHGDFFRIHSDTGEGELATREITFVYFFHSRPNAFKGGELRIYDSRVESGQHASIGTFKTVAPRHNQVVFFPSFLMHEVMPVHSPSRTFADSRFTVNGWICHS
jgi:SM-20-related protein